MTKAERGAIAALSAAVLAIVLLGLLFGERVQAGGGLGWDGQVYARMVRQLPAALWRGEFSPYYSQRIVAPLLVWLAVGSSASNSAMIAAFGVLNLMAVAGSLALWHLIANESRLSFPARVLGIAALFINFPVLKNAEFYPVLVDTTAIFLSLLMLYFFLRERIMPLFAVTVVSAVTWTGAGLTGALLLAFAGQRGLNTRWINSAWREVALTGAVVAACLYVGLLVPSLCANAAQTTGIPGLFDLNAEGRRMCSPIAAFLTGVPSIALVGIGCLMLASTRLPRPTRIMLPALACVGPFLVARLIAGDVHDGGTDLPTLARFMAMPPAHKPFLPIISTAVYWGPLALVGILLWPKVVREAHQLGHGMTGAILLALPLALVTEPRFLTFAWPFLVLCIVRATDTLPGLDRFAMRLLPLALLFSKVWMPINYARWPGPDFAQLDHFPKQAYFMNFGFWMSLPMFAVQSAVVLATAIVLWWRLFKMRAETPAQK